VRDAARAARQDARVTIPGPRAARHAAPLALAALALVVLAACGAPPSGPSAQGRVELAQTHGANAGTTMSTMTAGFVPDADGPGAPGTCSELVLGCAIERTPRCAAGCAPDEECAYDGACAPACRRPARFDAGAITFAGTTQPITVPPPYTPAPLEGPIFADGGELRVSAAGATVAGYAGFDETLTATTSLAADPPLAEQIGDDVFTGRDLDARWIAGNDTAELVATVYADDGEAIAIACPGDDDAGAGTLPRGAIDAALAGRTLDRLTFGVRRSRTRAVYPIDTLGTVEGQTVQPRGWLDLTTSSTEHVVVNGCADGEDRCEDGCTVLASDPAHCGSCDHACEPGDGCQDSACYGQASCHACADAASQPGQACAAASDACAADAQCAALRACVATCTGSQSCGQCLNDNPDGLALWGAWMQCQCDAGGCAAVCAGYCAPSG
jgi:hypothetical protein